MERLDAQGYQVSAPSRAVNWDMVDVRSLVASSPSATSPADEFTRSPPLNIPQSSIFPRKVDGHRGYKAARMAHDGLRSGAGVDFESFEPSRKTSRGRPRGRKKPSPTLHPEPTILGPIKPIESNGVPSRDREKVN